MINILFSSLLLFANLYIFVRSFINRSFSSLYWFSILVILSGPAVLDSIFGLPYLAYEGMIGFSTPFAENGLTNAIIFALGHLFVTWLVYLLWSGQIRNKERQKTSWIVSSKSFFFFLFACFSISSIIIIFRKSDLSRPFNDFLLEGTRPQYEMYFFLASSPIMALVGYRRKNSWFLKILLAASSVIVSYFIGIRYYMFPFIGFLVWNEFLKVRTNGFRKLTRLTLIAVVAWLGLTLWGIIRFENLRSNPLAIFDNISPQDLKDRLFVGNELAARVSYYDLMARPGIHLLYRGIESIKAIFLSVPYPMVMRPLGIELPISNSKIIYEIQTGIIGTGVSTGVTAFGNDWFSWGWWGIIIGGGILGSLLFLVDFIQKKSAFWWIIIGPMAAFQLIFFARGGTDVWLGIWGRYLPITFVLVFASWFIEQFNTRFMGIYGEMPQKGYKNAHS